MKENLQTARLHCNIKFVFSKWWNQEMEGSRKERPWGKLVKVDSSETVLLFNTECTVGRKKGKFAFICDQTKDKFKLDLTNPDFTTSTSSSPQHRPCCCQSLVLFKTSPLKTQRLLWCSKLRQPLVTVTKALHWEHVCRILSRFFFCMAFCLRKG